MKKSLILFIILIIVVGAALVIASLFPQGSQMHEAVMSFIVTVGVPALIAAMPWTTHQRADDPKDASISDTKPALVQLIVKLFSILKTRR